jgi:hypothetical protein
MRVAPVALLMLAALAAARATAAPDESASPPKPVSLVPHAPAPGRTYGAPIQGQILHKRVRKKPPAASSAPIS